MTEDRALLNRSLDLSHKEQDGLRRAAETQRDRLSSIVGTIGDALSEFGSYVQSDTSSGQIATAKNLFTTRLHEILNETQIGDERSSDVSLIRGNLARLADQLIILLADTAERAAIKKELEVARAVQGLLLPPDDVIDHPRSQAVGYFQPAAEIGGDWWTVTDLADGRVLTVIGDVTGHGVSSAIITGAAKAACDLAIEVTSGKLEANELLGMMNAALFRIGRKQMMMTCAVTIHDPRAGTLALANAAHPNPIMIRQGVIHPLLAEGAPLGAIADAVYQQVQVRIEPGDVLVCFTDGIVECENERGEQFSERRVRAICQRAASGGALKVREALLEAVSSFRASAAQTDDLTFVATSFR
ncbi:MAG: PP2C family protein-serine/threonine phosphatase [Kofleriaceae bacterium]